MRGFLWILALSALLLPGSVDARVEESLTYTKQQGYNSALRFLRVDRGYTLVEKSMESGYLLFEYPISGSTEKTHGSIEIVERKDEIALIVQLPQMPRYHERMLASGLLKKLLADYGAPPAARTPPDSKKPEDSKKKEKDPKAEGDKPDEDDAPKAAPEEPPSED